MRGAFLYCVALVAIAACLDSVAPISIGAEYQLRRINGQAIPWTTPPTDSAYIETTVTEGSVTFVDATRANRTEKFGRWVLVRPGDSTWIGGEWAASADYRWIRPGKMVLSYLAFMPGAIGPPQGAETLYVNTHGDLILRQTGLVSPIDSIVRVYCTRSC